MVFGIVPIVELLMSILGTGKLTIRAGTAGSLESLKRVLMTYLEHIKIIVQVARKRRS